MKAALLALGLLALTPASQALAACADDLAALDRMLAAAELDPDEQAQLKDMRAQAAQLCAAGNEEEASDVIAEATSILEGQ